MWTSSALSPRQSRTLRVADQVIREFDEGVSRAFGDLGEPGPVYLEIPTDVLRAHVSANLVLDEWMAPKKTRVIAPDEATVARTVDALWSAKRPLVVTGRGARQAGPEIVRLLDALGAVYLDTQESRGLIPDQSSRGGRRDARGGDDGSRHRLRDRPQA